jgi:hypothetical protein
MESREKMQIDFQKHLGAIALALAIVLAALIYAFATRYQHVPNDYFQVFDRWTGQQIHHDEP